MFLMNLRLMSIYISKILFCQVAIKFQKFDHLSPGLFSIGEDFFFLIDFIIESVVWRNYAFILQMPINSSKIKPADMKSNDALCGFGASYLPQWLLLSYLNLPSLLKYCISDVSLVIIMNYEAFPFYWKHFIKNHFHIFYPSIFLQSERNYQPEFHWRNRRETEPV